MAKRKRLSPAQPGYLGAEDAPASAPERKSMPLPGTSISASAPPISQVAADSATAAALTEVTGVLQDARRDGLLIERLGLDVIDDRYLVRDRLEQDEDEMEALITSLRARGQQSPIEVIALPDAAFGPTHGLISGWRRLTALRRLYEETGDEVFARVKAMVITPETAQDAYVAMVEENEIRVNLSLYERARIALRAAREGVYPTHRTALQGLFGAATRSKRSKIGTFISVVEALDDTLRFPTAIPEKLGLSVARELVRDPGFAQTLKSTLQSAKPTTPGDELRLLAGAVTQASAPASPPSSMDGPRVTALDGAATGRDRRKTDMAPGVTARFSRKTHRIELSGSGVDEALFVALKAWLKTH